MKLLQLFLGRLPERKNILGVYAVIVTLVYSWTLFTSFYKLPSWIFYLTIWQILSVYAYAFSVNLAESLLALTGVLILEFTLFLALKKREEFQSRSILLILVVLISAMARLALFQTYGDVKVFLSSESVWWALTLLLGLPLAVFAPKSNWIRNILEGIADRASVLLYIYLPISFVSLIVVMIRNIN
jgi:membrane-associated HD superfamily phosphohydrolase